jgi:hypothetical protein
MNSSSDVAHAIVVTSYMDTSSHVAHAIVMIVLFVIVVISYVVISSDVAYAIVVTSYMERHLM